MSRTVAAVAVAIAVALAPAAAVAADVTREDALRTLADRGSSDEQRRRAVARLGDVGTMADMDTLVRALRDRRDDVRAFAERSMWQIWHRSGDDDVDRLLETGIEQMTSRAGDAAVDTFTRVIERRPAFAEGWNKRATVYYLMGEYAKSLADCDEVMKRNPYHFGALSGYGMIYVQLGQPQRALEYFERALDINPNLDGVRTSADALRRLILDMRRNTL
ncbi:MAG: tetratricopeptide repeat protein [Candidatus Rokubacteria bacterium]|nr:tetratricopeptide repeat protein [Candidatus Rokubacteria bacterium]